MSTLETANDKLIGIFAGFNHLRDFFKFEFFYPEKQVFRRQLEEELAGRLRAFVWVVLLVAADTYQIAQQIDNMEPLLTPQDESKIALLKSFLREHVDLDSLGVTEQRLSDENYEALAELAYHGLVEKAQKMAAEAA